jgi:hypothetical protein
MAEKFDYLLDLPFEIIIQVLSELDIKDLDSFCRSSKQVDYAEEKMEMKELCNEIWRNKFFKKFKYDSSLDENKSWRVKYLDQYQKYYMKNMQELFKNINRFRDTNDDKSWISIFDFVVENKEFFELKPKSLSLFRDIIFTKLKELSENQEYANKYIKILFE